MSNNNIYFKLNKKSFYSFLFMHLIILCLGANILNKLYGYDSLIISSYFFLTLTVTTISIVFQILSLEAKYIRASLFNLSFYQLFFSPIALLSLRFNFLIFLYSIISFLTSTLFLYSYFKKFSFSEDIPKFNIPKGLINSLIPYVFGSGSLILTSFFITENELGQYTLFYRIYAISFVLISLIYSRYVSEYIQKGSDISLKINRMLLIISLLFIIITSILKPVIFNFYSVSPNLSVDYYGLMVIGALIILIGPISSFLLAEGNDNILYRYNMYFVSLISLIVIIIGKYLNESTFYVVIIISLLYRTILKIMSSKNV